MNTTENSAKKSQYINLIPRNQQLSHPIIGDWELPEGAVVAPMAGITDSPYRHICRRFGAGLLYSEVISAEGLRRRGRKTFELVEFQDSERPLAIQLFGKEPQQFADAVAILLEQYQPELIDINCGCPVKKFVTRDVGGWLMQFPDLIGRIVEAVKKVSSTPVSVKLRSGYRLPDETAPIAAANAEAAGASLVAIHARYVRGSKDTSADWDVIGRVKAAVKNIPVIGNGDIFSRADAQKMMTQTGCDRVMIGRGCAGRPWIFSSMLNIFEQDFPVYVPTMKDRINILLNHYKLMLEYLPTKRAIHRMRKHIGWYTHGMHGSARIRAELMLLDDDNEVISRLEEYRDIRLKDEIPPSQSANPAEEAFSINGLTSTQE